MKYIGTSLGGCLLSILAGEVSEDDVMFIVTRTNAPSFDDYIAVVTMYHMQGNPYSTNPHNYELSSYPLEQVTDLSIRLWNAGKIHQPRVFAPHGIYRHPLSSGSGLWLEVMTPYAGSNPAVVDAYDKYKMVRTLVDEGI